MRAETFERLRRGANFDRWQQFVRQFLDEKKQPPSHALTVAANVVVSRENIDELSEIVRLVAELGFDGVSFLDVIPIDDVAAAMCPPATAAAAAARKDALRLARRLGLRTFRFYRHARVPPQALPNCLQPWEHLFIRAGGDVAPCCAVFGSDTAIVMGNLLRQEFHEVWHGEPFRTFRRTSMLGTNPLCRVCPYR